MTFEQWWAETGTDIYMRSMGYEVARAAWNAAIASCAPAEVATQDGWTAPHITPDTEREVLMLMKSRGTQSRRERIQIGYYSAGLSWWRPRGSNGNFSDEVEGWRELPSLDMNRS